ncbi:glycosyltransferase family 4 protein [Allorhizobium sp. BGMRC 0089]|uniref:glycosyltransferase family 4 protein n=1 Tax=Allorhizobium sonneratiae TaxID=2934936 RepID=UPI002033DD66|nr:glycosyltransferase family 4 protein [Allorhizobium sonneratiae]MCM2294735.1 glycosyltransferase family 4 protein [Allorhizobium sonneratiae]
MCVGAIQSVGLAANDHAPLIVQVVRQFLPGRGGLEDVVAGLSRELVRQGFRVRVVTLNRLFSAPDHILPAHEIIDGVEVVRIPFHGSRRYPLALSVWRHLDDADLVHVHGIDFFFDALAITGFFHGKPMVATTHGGFFHTHAYSALKQVWFQTLTRLSTRAYRALACCSSSDHALFAKIAGQRAVLIENGVDIEKFADRAAPMPVRQMITIGRFSENKRLERLLEMMAVLVGRDDGWRLTIAGVESDLSAAELQAMIAAQGLGMHVRLMLNPDNQTLARLISEASLFVSASDYEGFGLVAVEAMSAGLIPVLQDNQAYRALAARHGDVTVTDFTEAEKAAAACLDAFQRLMREGTPLRNKIMAESLAYSWASVAERYIGLYRRAGLGLS